MTDLFSFRKKPGMVGINLIGLLLLCSVLYPGWGWAQTRGITMEEAATSNGLPYEGGTYRALIIGNDNYRGKGSWKSLTTAVTGARALDNLLRTRYGFTDVALLENATRKDILLALLDLSRRVETNDSVVMYYAGHGYLNVEAQRGYWVPVDAMGSDHTTYLRNSTIRDELSIIASRAKHTLLISDSCFSGTLLRSGTRGISTETGTNAYYRKVATKKSIQILTAGGVEYVDDAYATSGHSPFTYFLLSELKNNDRPLLTASELSTSVEKAVGNNVDQVPQSGVLHGVGDEMGEFVFVNIDVVVSGVPKENVKVNVNVVEAEEPPEKPGDMSLRLGVELAPTHWGGDNPATEGDIDGNGTQLGLNLRFQKSRFYTGLELKYGRFSFDEKAPVQVTKSGMQRFQDVKIDRTELDLDLGYYFWKHVSLFLKLKAVTNKWDNSSYELDHNGIGGGVAFDWPIAQRWELFGSLALIPKQTTNGDSEDIGDTFSGQLELGAVHKFKNNHRLGFGLNLNLETCDFDMGDKAEHQFIGLFVSYDYQFNL